eukprot:UN04665
MKIKLSQLVPKIVDKWSYELLHRAKMGESQAMMTVAQIQFSRHGWGRIRPDAVQGRRWLEYGASRGDTQMHHSLQNLRTAIAARQQDLEIGRAQGLIDINKRAFDGKTIVPPSEQLKLPPINFNRVITNNPTNVVERTSEEEALEILYKQKFQPIQDTIAQHKQKMLEAAKRGEEYPKVKNTPISEPINFQELENKRLNLENQVAREFSEKIKAELREKVKRGDISVKEAQNLIRKLEAGESIMEKKQTIREGKTFDTIHPKPDSPQRR